MTWPERADKRAELRTARHASGQAGRRRPISSGQAGSGPAAAGAQLNGLRLWGRVTSQDLSPGALQAVELSNIGGLLPPPTFHEVVPAFQLESSVDLFTTLVPRERRG